MKKNLAKQKPQSGNRERSELLGSDHKQARAEIQSNLREGYYVSHSGKKAIRVLHYLGRCHMLPGVDYLSFNLWWYYVPGFERLRHCLQVVCKVNGAQGTFLDHLGHTLLHQAMIDVHISMSLRSVSSPAEVRRQESRRDS